MSTNTHNYYLSYLRTGMAAKVKRTDPNQQRVTIPVTVQSSARGKNVQRQVTSEVSVALYGPGDVLGFHKNVIVKNHPVQDEGSFNPSLIPFVEFGEPDFLWRYSAKKAENKYWVPWLSLVVLKNKDGQETGEFTLQKNSNRALPPQLKISSKAKLPDLNQTWRWAHIHTNEVENQPKAAIQDKILQNPHKAVCRLLCPRRLQPNTKYTAFVIPTYQLGVEAALGENMAASATLSNELAWQTPTKGKGKIVPYYYHWEFSTGIRGDFEYLVKQLKFRPLDHVSTRLVDCSNPGYGLKNTRDAKVGFEGALRASTQAASDTTSATTKKGLAKVLNARVTTENGEEIVRVVPPMYGQWYAQSGQNNSLKLNPNKANWVNELNLNYSYRYAAGLGVEFIKDNQEVLMKAAWQQYDELQKVNRRLNTGKFGRAVSSCMYKRLKGLKEEKLLQLGLPLNGKVKATSELQETNQRRSRNATRNVTTIRGQIHKSEMLNSVGQLKMKKYLVRKFDRKKSTKEQTLTTKRMEFTPVLLANNQIQESSQLKKRAAKLGKDILQTIDPKQAIEKRLSNKFAAVRQWERRKQQAKRPLLARSSSNPQTPKDPLRPVMWSPEFHTPMYRYLRDKSQDLLLPGLDKVLPNTVSILTTNTKFIEAFLMGLNHEFAAELRWREYPTDMRGTYFRKFWDTTIYSVDKREKVLFRRSVTGKAMLQKVKKAYPAYNTFPKIEGVFETPSPQLNDLDRAVAKLYEQAIERWLLIREEDKDITRITDWSQNSALGTHALTNQNGSAEGQIVLLLRGDILNKFPNMLIYLATKKTETKPNYKNRLFPIFEGNIPSDIVLLGFPITRSQYNNYFLVFEEPMSEVQYGLDETDDAKSRDSFTNTSWQHFSNLGTDGYLSNKKPSNLSTSEWKHPAFIAKVFTQKSVRISIPLSRFFPT